MTYFLTGHLGETPFAVRYLTMDDLQAIEALQQRVYEALPVRSVLQPLTTEEFEAILQDEKMMIGVFIEEEMIGFRALLNPPIEEEHLGYDCGVPEDQFHRVLYQEISNVAPEYRGYGLQKKMAQWSMERIDQTRYDYVCSTVQPYNIPSLKDKFSQGLVVKALKIKYVDKLRYVFFKDLRTPNPTYVKKETIVMHDTEGQQKLLKNGFVGTKMYEENDEWYVVYEK